MRDLKKKLEKERDEYLEVDEDSDLPVHEKYTKGKKKILK